MVPMAAMVDIVFVVMDMVIGVVSMVAMEVMAVTLARDLLMLNPKPILRLKLILLFFMEVTEVMVGMALDIAMVSLEDMVDMVLVVMEDMDMAIAVVSMVAMEVMAITWARGLLTLNLKPMRKLIHLFFMEGMVMVIAVVSMVVMDMDTDIAILVVMEDTDM